MTSINNQNTSNANNQNTNIERSSQMNEMQIFKNEEFGQVRTLIIDNEPWFVGKDVAEILGYNNTRDALAKRVDDEDKMDGVAIRDSIGREQHPTFINESGLYSLVLSSKLPGAKKFKRWIFNSILNSNKGDKEIMKNNQSNAIQVFDNPEFGKIRTLTENGKTLFCGKDVAAALGYNEPHKAIARHCKGGTKRPIGVQTGTKADGSPATQQIEMLFIPEGDIYRLAARSELPSAEKFESWIFDEVIPSIRKHGMYVTESTLEKVMNDPDFMIGLLQNIKEERRKNEMLLAENSEKQKVIEQQTEQIEEMKPKVSYYDIVLNCKDLVSMSAIAKDYGESASWMNKRLHEKGVQFKQGGIWLLYQKYANQGYTGTKTHTYSKTNGELGSKMHTYWTQKGRLFIYDLLKEDNILPLVEREN